MVDFSVGYKNRLFHEFYFLFIQFICFGQDTIRTLVATIVTQGMAQPEALKQIEGYARQVQETGRRRFVEVVETELLSLHAGNIARYRIRPFEFENWQGVWNGPDH